MRPARLALAPRAYKAGTRAVQVWAEGERRPVLQVYQPIAGQQASGVVWSAPVPMSQLQLVVRALGLLEEAAARVYGVRMLTDGWRAWADPEFIEFKRLVLQARGFVFEGRIGSPDNWEEYWQKVLR